MFTRSFCNGEVWRRPRLRENEDKMHLFLAPQESSSPHSPKEKVRGSVRNLREEVSFSGSLLSGIPLRASAGEGSGGVACLGERRIRDDAQSESRLSVKCVASTDAFIA